MNPLIQYKKTTTSLVVASMFVGSTLSPLLRAQATCPAGPRVTCCSNLAVGCLALDKNGSGDNNTAIGNSAMSANRSGSYNTATGYNALDGNIGGKGNTATGAYTMFYTNADYNTATGWKALQTNSRGEGNVAIGAAALNDNTSGSWNTGIGYQALPNNTSGKENVAIGTDALPRNTTGSYNIAIGTAAGSQLTTGHFNVDIAADGVAGESNTVRIGSADQTRTFVAGISGVAVTGAAVSVNGAGQLGTAPSSKRFKDEIKPMERASEALFALKPVSFRYKKEIEPGNIGQFGLVAEEVEKVNPALVVHDKEGKPYSVRYDQVNAMLLNEFLKEHKAFAEQERKVQELEATVTSLVATVREQAVQIQKVRMHVDASRPASRVAVVSP